MRFLRRRKNLVKASRTVVEIQDDLHGQLKRLALLNDLRIHELANTVIGDFLQDSEQVKATIRKLHSEGPSLSPILGSRFARGNYLQSAFSFTNFLHQYQ